jgi:excisionase family DNA binding protein
MRSQSARLSNFLTVRDVADRLSVSEKTVRRWIASAALPHHRLGNAVRIDADDFLAFVGSRRR